MSRGTAGSLVVSLGLDAAEFTAGLTKSQYEAKKFSQNLEVGLKSIAGTFTALSGAAIAAGAALLSVADSLAKYQDLADQIGATAVQVAGLQLAADASGASLETVAAASVKLTAALTQADDESKKAGAALAAINIPIEEFKRLDPVAQLDRVATELAKFENGAGKTAVAVDLFGKSGAALIPFLNDLAELGSKNARVTAEQIEAADKLSKQFAIARSEATQLGQAFIVQLIPPILRATNAAIEAVKQFGFLGAIRFNMGRNPFANGLNEIADAQAKVTAAQKELDSFKPTGRAFGLDDAKVKSLRESVQLREKELGYLKTEYGLNSTAGAGRGSAQVSGLDLNYSGTPDKPKKGAKDDPTGKELENALKALEAGVKQEQDILSARSRMLDLYNAEALISTQDYYAGKRVALEDNVAKEAAIYDKEISLLVAYQAAADKATERETTQGKINDLVEKKAKLYRDAGEAALEMGFKERKSAEDLQKQLNAVNADVLELTGNLSAASKIRLDAQYEDLAKRLSVNGDSAGKAQLDRLKQLKTAQAESAQQSEEISRITASLQVQEDRISLSRQIGADTELSALVKTGDARRAAVAQMQSYVTAQEAIAKASGNPALVQNAERARVELEKLQAVADPLGDKFNAIFVDSFGNAFADFITGSKTASEAFQAFGRSVINQLANIAAQEAATALFGKSAKGGSSGLFGSLFSLGSMALGDYTGTSIGGTYGTSTQAGLDALFASVGGKAGGGGVAANSLQEVNENGPELLDYAGRQYLMMGDKAGRVIANGGAGTGETNWSIVNQTTGRVDNVVEQRVSPTERVLIMQETRKQVWAELSDRNSMGSKAMSRNFNLQRA